MKNLCEIVAGKEHWKLYGKFGVYVDFDLFINTQSKITDVQTLNNKFMFETLEPYIREKVA